MAETTRFAPSPTGRLHLRHAASAWLARTMGERFLLRIEDIDPGRCREKFVEAIEEDLRWLGLRWDGPEVRQSDRLTSYQRALAQLRAERLLYPCFCTRAEITAEVARAGLAPHAEDAGPPYPGTCRALGTTERTERIAAGQAHVWRLDMMEAVRVADPLRWHDRRAGWQNARPELHGDVVLARKDAPASYHLAVTGDDAAQGVTLVSRGTDMFAATHVHRLLQALLGLPTPDYLHHPLLADANGRRLAKRDGAPTLASMRAAGADPASLVRGFAAWAEAAGLPIYGRAGQGSPQP
ncbi:MAG: tRNA glutamyl-Q(34) synthetase GluQRS [Sphingomonadaceae bacterium]|nr:tRNA glutamyl-Q(34) synthetase GluQRS [Sphingomonadaceae bacterium]